MYRARAFSHSHVLRKNYCRENEAELICQIFKRSKISPYQLFLTLYKKALCNALSCSAVAKETILVHKLFLFYTSYLNRKKDLNNDDYIRLLMLYKSKTLLVLFVLAFSINLLCHNYVIRVRIICWNNADHQRK